LAGHGEISCFQPKELAILDQAAQLASELVSEAYGLDFGDYLQWPIDIRHWPQLTPQERSHGPALAQLFRYRRPTPIASSSRPDYWRICLYDPAILAAAEREKLSLNPFLCYILTHEFIHVARFIRFFEIFGLDDSRRAAEEAKVGLETEKLLAGLTISGLDKILELYRQGSLALDDNLV
jgi:hypothetical protein